MIAYHTFSCLVVQCLVISYIMLYRFLSSWRARRWPPSQRLLRRQHLPGNGTAGGVCGGRGVRQRQRRPGEEALHGLPGRLSGVARQTLTTAPCGGSSHLGVASSLAVVVVVPYPTE